MHELSMWLLTLLQICFLIFKTSYRNKQCSVMLKTQMVDLFAIKFILLTLKTDLVREFLKILAISVLVSYKPVSYKKRV